MTNLEIKIDGSEDYEVHACQTHHEGDWIVFTCPKCPDYHRRINRKTREMRVSHSVNSEVLHAGSFSQHALDHAFNHEN